MRGDLLGCFDITPEGFAALTRLALDSYDEYAALLGVAGWNAYRSNIVSTMEDPKGATCLVATQRRHPADTDLVAHGADVEEWLTIAQAFAGPPGAGRKPGQFA